MNLTEEKGGIDTERLDRDLKAVVIATPPTHVSHLYTASTFASCP